VDSATGADAIEGKCSAMLGAAPEIVHRLEAVQTCRGANAGCGYIQVAPESGVLTLFCSAGGPVQIFGERLNALHRRRRAAATDRGRATRRGHLRLLLTTAGRQAPA
jgi:hypothetical protein